MLFVYKWNKSFTWELLFHVRMVDSCKFSVSGLLLDECRTFI